MLMGVVALHEGHGEGIVAYDVLTGDELDPQLMRQARRDEIAYFKQMRVYDKVRIEEAIKETSQKTEDKIREMLDSLRDK